MSTTTLPAGLTAGTYAVDPSHSEVGFTARHAMVTKVRGSFSDVEGTVVLDEDANLISVRATVQIASIDTRNADRDAHLRGADFFDAEQFPTLEFRSTRVELGGDGFVVTGDLTLHGVTQQVQLDVEATGVATDPFGNARAGFSAETEINRKDFGLVWNAALETGGVLVSEKVKVSLDISAIKQA
ncbi:YceI family protein [Quadrisphaera sp. DSM 44207]|uniref:YceI family protein n=1 Tax=Quadrisphaera sp. DSM 44207 TaxID=1881057 RepID=UPI00088183F0|nr:YceI family protein [Quadrisphaera sp. DSM 44207]SDQ16016.1 Polyisoprenoid-binding protein YceI [Quadrisphaera sp. DSM 44207]